ncbi:hypothetical protein JIN85_15815 [Luteolibacter pohnpeiensis]|uniref:Uncharacterized protein n=1 Tax=Luteolibacter pohnpeiensis TaxID=454153 RepID=A0A934S6A6_9BACT|nr:hypothetical protein [Luteolibacter pohnpeiensis]MBK1883885.1 hypothetical protein [Luteolibacter pohnpeiensis]
MNDHETPSWTDLSQRARSATPPVIDVRHAVLAAIPSRRPSRPKPNLAEILLSSSHHWGVRFAFGCCVLATGLIGYGGYRATEDLSLLMSFAF